MQDVLAGHIPGAALTLTVRVAMVAPKLLACSMLEPLLKHAPDLIPWAWAINGCASVISAVLATLLAIHLGFTTVIATALVLYALTLWVFPTPRKF